MGIETQLRDEVAVMAARLAEKFSEQFAAAGKLVDIEELSEQIGDEVTRQLASRELAKRSAESACQSEHDCPTCGRSCTRILRPWWPSVFAAKLPIRVCFIRHIRFAGTPGLPPTRCPAAKHLGSGLRSSSLRDLTV